MMDAIGLQGREQFIEDFHQLFTVTGKERIDNVLKGLVLHVDTPNMDQLIVVKVLPAVLTTVRAAQEYVRPSSACC